MQTSGTLEAPTQAQVPPKSMVESHRYTHLFWRQTGQCLVWNVLRKRQTASVSRQDRWHRLRNMQSSGHCCQKTSVSSARGDCAALGCILFLCGEAGGAALCGPCPLSYTLRNPTVRCENHIEGVLLAGREAMTQLSCLHPEVLMVSVASPM